MFFFTRLLPAAVVSHHSEGKPPAVRIQWLHWRDSHINADCVDGGIAQVLIIQKYPISIVPLRATDAKMKC